MAIKGTITKKLRDAFNLYLDFKWQRTNFSRTNNTSTISWEIVLRDEALLAWFDSDSIPISLNIDGKTTNEVLNISGTTFKTYGTETVSKGTRTITHNTDGTKTFSVNFIVNFGNEVSSGDLGGSHEISGNFTLDRITRASGVTCTTVNIGVAPVITIDTQDSRYAHLLTYGFGDEEVGYITGTIYSGVIGNTNGKTVIDDFVWPESFYQVIPNSKSGTGTIFCTTYGTNGKIVGEQTRCNFTANVNEGSSTPVFEGGYPKIKDTNSDTIALTGNDSKLIRYASTARVEIGAKARNYATIARQKVKNGTNYHEEYTNELVTISFGNVTSPTFSFELEDSRGYITKPGRDLSATDSFVEYFLPTCNIGNNKPGANGNLTITCNGSWFNDSFGAVDNSITVQYRYRLEHSEWQNTESEWHSMPVNISGNSYDASVSFTIPNFDYLAGYVYEARVKDKLFTVNSAEYEVKSAALFSWSEEDFEFNVPVKFNAGAEGIPNSGGGEAPDLSKYALKTEIPTALPNPYALTINGQTYDGSKAVSVTVQNGTWAPALDKAAISSYTIRYGWYQKIGKVVTIGFNIKATCNSGYDDYPITITGIPFTPQYDASGGGVCSGANVGGGFNFECWVAGTNGYITGRVQSCNHTSPTNLSTSASGLFMRDGGGEITLGGTICYITN